MYADTTERLANLMRSANAGDAAAYANFLSEAAVLLRGFTRRKVAGNTALDPEDIVQEALLAIHLKRHTWRSDEPIGPWIFAIARYKAVDAFRRRGMQTEIDIDDLREELRAPEDERHFTEREISRALDGLAGRQRVVVSAMAVEGRSVREVAEALGSNEGAVGVAFHRGLAAVAARYGKN